MKKTDDHINQLYEDLQEELQLYAEMGAIPVRKLGGALQSMRDTLAKLKAHIQKYPLANVQEEINFFKNEKPRFVAEQLYAVDVCLLQTTRPLHDDGLIRVFLEEELRLIKRHFEKYSFLYQYFRLDSADLDTVFFVRGAYPTGVLLPDAKDGDPEFSTACDHAWARFIAHERLQQWLLDELDDLEERKRRRVNGGRAVEAEGPGQRGADGRRGDTAFEGGDNFAGLKWTGDSINLAELGYGIWLTGQINNGNASVTEIMEGLEGMFKVKIGTAHRRWQSIAGRKRVASFKYMDELKAALAKRLEEEWGR